VRQKAVGIAIMFEDIEESDSGKISGREVYVLPGTFVYREGYGISGDAHGLWGRLYAARVLPPAFRGKFEELSSATTQIQKWSDAGMTLHPL
jgi:hypothetical protein